MNAFNHSKEARLQLLKEAIENLRPDNINDNQLDQLLKILELSQGSIQPETVNFEVD